MTKEDILNYVKKEGIALIRFVYIDNDGVIRSYAATADMLAGDLNTGHNYAIAMPFFSVLDDLVPGTRFGCTGEVCGVPDPESFRVLPHVPDSAMVICDFRRKKDHGACGLCARSLLKSYLGGLNYDANVAMENEFYLIVRDENGRYAPFDRSRCFSTTGMNQQHAMVAEMVRCLKAQGLTVEKYYPEYGQGQVEIVYRYDTALRTGDNQVFFRETVKGVAQKHGVIASFMPKPFAGSAGSGAHLHISLSRDGRNLFYDAGDEHGLTRTARFFIGGLLKHMQALCAFTAATVNSYKRLLPHNWASAFVCWGMDNREAAVRVCPGAKGSEAEALNIEIKPVDGACNPHLAILAALAAGMDGVENCIDPGPPLMRDPYDLTAEERRRLNITRLPTTLGEAVAALEADAFFRSVLGDVFFEEYILLKRFAWNRYIEHVSEWESDLYMEAF